MDFEVIGTAWAPRLADAGWDVTGERWRRGHAPAG